MSRKRYIQHLRSKETETIQQYGLDKVTPKVPEADIIKEGEIAINYAEDNEVISIKNEENDIVKFLNEKVTYENEEIVAAALAQLKSEIANEINNINETIENFEPGDGGNGNVMVVNLRRVMPIGSHTADEDVNGGVGISETLTSSNNDIITNESISLTCDTEFSDILSAWYEGQVIFARFGKFIFRMVQLNGEEGEEIAVFNSVNMTSGDGDPNNLSVISCYGSANHEWELKYDTVHFNALLNSIPENTSDLTNDSGFITINDIPEAFEDVLMVTIQHDIIPGDEEIETISSSTSFEEIRSAVQSGKEVLANVVSTENGTSMYQNPSIFRIKMCNDRDAVFIHRDGIFEIAYGVDSNDEWRRIDTKLDTQSDWNVTNRNSMAFIKNKPTALSDFTNDSNFITISDVPAINNAPLVIQKNGTDVATFTANAADRVFANIEVPTKTSDLNNDSGFITMSDVTGQVQSDWDESNERSMAYIQNKPIFILHMTIEPSELDKTVSISETYEELAMAIKNGKTILLWGAAMQGEYLYTIDSDNGGRVMSDSIDPRTGNYIFYFARVTDSGNIVIYGFGKGINNTLTLKVFNSLDEVLCVTITSQRSVQSNEVLTNISCDIPCRLIYQSYIDGVNIIAKNTINDAYGLNGVDSARVYRLVKATPFIAADGNTLGNDGTLQFVSYEVGDNLITTYTYNATFDGTSDDEWKYRSEKFYIPLYVKLTSKVTALATNDYFNITSDTDYSTIVNAYLNNRVVVLRNCVVEEGQSTLRPDDTGHVYYLRRKHGTSKLQFIAIEDVQATLDHSLKLFIFEVDSDNVWKYRREEIPYIYNANWIEYGIYDNNNPTYRKIERYDELLEAINNGQMIKLQNYLATAIDTSLVEDENKIILKFGSSDFKPNGTVTTVSITKYDNYCVVAFEYLGSHYDASWILNKDQWTNEELIEKYVLLGDAVDYKETIFITPSHDECLYATRALHDNIHNQLEVTFFKTDPSIITYQVTLTGGNVEIDSEEFLLATEPQP